MPLITLISWGNWVKCALWQTFIPCHCQCRWCFGWFVPRLVHSSFNEKGTVPLAPVAHGSYISSKQINSKRANELEFSICICRWNWYQYLCLLHSINSKTPRLDSRTHGVRSLRQACSKTVSTDAVSESESRFRIVLTRNGSGGMVPGKFWPKSY